MHHAVKDRAAPAVEKKGDVPVVGDRSGEKCAGSAWIV
jgi:hypothetical protein